MRRNFLVAAFAVSVPASLAAVAVGSTRGPSAAVPGSDTVVAREAWLMGAPLRIRVAAADRDAGLAAIEAAFVAVEGLEAELSSWRDDSDLGRIRSAPVGEPVRVRPRTARLLAEAGAWSSRTEGAFDPAIGALIDAWDLRGVGRVPAPRALEAARAASGWGRVRLDAENARVTRLDAGTWLDAGGFGKGAALRIAAAALASRGVEAALLDFGGQLLALGDDPSGGAAGWPASLAHPARRDSAHLSGRLVRGSAATSGRSERDRTLPEGRIGHLLDPRTGAPAPAWGSVTVVADDPVTADALATALFVMGPREGPSWLRDRDDAGAVFLIDRPGAVEVIAAGALEGRLVLDGPAFGSGPGTRADRSTR